jgi:hypothetical protein
MTKRCGLAAGLVAVLAATAAILISFSPKSETAARAAFGRIAVGMTEAEVRLLFGGPPQYRNTVKGLVRDPESFITNSDLATQTQ